MVLAYRLDAFHWAQKFSISRARVSPGWSISKQWEPETKPQLNLSLNLVFADADTYLHVPILNISHMKIATLYPTLKESKISFSTRLYDKVQLQSK
jgi:hypothetical protein